MSIKKLERVFSPGSIAVIGASNDSSKVGYGVFRNIIKGGFKGNVYAINSKRKKIQGRKAFCSVKDIGKEVDVAIIATPASIVPMLLRECAEVKVKAVIIMSSGFMEAGKEGVKLTNEVMRIARKNKIRIMGPNCMGFIRPSISLNASFSKKSPKEGNIAFISQSGALGSSTLDWALKNDLGFSFFASLGTMIDISFNDLIDYLGNDPYTNSIVIYMESIKDARSFMSAARSFSLKKPIIVLKAGKSSEGSRAAMSHTGNLTGNDDVFNAAFKRGGIVRVERMDDLFDCAKTLSKQKTPKGNRLAIITNAGGPGVISTDFLIRKGGRLAGLEKKTIKELNKFLPNAWSHSNPVDLLGDAGEDDYKRAIEVCLNDKNVDGILVLLTPQTMTDCEKIANSISSLKSDKPILTSFMGGEEVKKSKEILEKNNVPNFPFPERAVMAFMYLYDYHKNIDSIYQTPGTIPHAFNPRTDKNKELIEKVVLEKRYVLKEFEAKELLENYDIPVLKQKVCRSKNDVFDSLKEFDFPLAMKVSSSSVIHKSDIGGVVLNIKSEKEAESAFNKILKSVRGHYPDSNINEVIVSPMVNKRYELIIGSKKDSIFGPTIIFGMGGVAVDVFSDFQIGLPPLNMHLSELLIKETKIYNLLKGYRGVPGVNLNHLQFILYKFSYLISDFPEIKEIDINPFSIDENGGIVVDAKVILDKKYILSRKKGKNMFSHLVISPYPKEFVKKIKMKDKREVILRPVKPEDEPLEKEMFKHFSKETQRFRFFKELKRVDHNLLVRYTHNDYDRELGIVAELRDKDKVRIVGVVRIIMDPYDDSAEFAIVVADPWQKKGLGSQMMDYILEVAKKKGFKKIYAYSLKDNFRMNEMFEKRGFKFFNEQKAFRFEKKL